MTLLKQKNETLEIPETFKNQNGNLDREQLLDDIDRHLEGENDINALKGVLAEIEARVKDVK